MNLFKQLLSVRPIINILAGLALLIVLLIEFYLKKIPEIFAHGHDLGEVVYRICLSIISSYIFYFIVIHLKAQSDKKNINAYVARKVLRIYGECSAQLNDLAKTSDMLGEHLWKDLEAIKPIFRVLNPNGRAPLIVSYPPVKYATWLQYFDSHRRDTTEIIEKIFRKMPFLDSKLVALLAKLEDCRHFTMIKSSVAYPAANETLDVWADPFIGYVDICKELNAYFEQNLRSHA